jgi:hypothetical protein
MTLLTKRTKCTVPQKISYPQLARNSIEHPSTGIGIIPHFLTKGYLRLFSVLSVSTVLSDRLVFATQTTLLPW